MSIQLNPKIDYEFELELYAFGNEGGRQTGTISMKDSVTGPKHFESLEELPNLIRHIVGQDRSCRTPY